MDLSEQNWSFEARRSSSWYFGAGTIADEEIDFETVALHELGHGHQLGHVINSSNVMHYTIAKKTINTTSLSFVEIMVCLILNKTLILCYFVNNNILTIIFKCVYVLQVKS